MSSDPTPARPSPRRTSPPDPYADLWEGADRRRKAYRRSRRHTMRVTIVSVIAVVVTGLLAVPLVQHWMPLRGTSSTVPGPAGVVPSSARGTNSGPADPFAGTPAEGYARGVDGIALPKATAVGGWQPQQVAAVLKRTRDVLVAARLDPQVIERGDTERYLDLLAPATRSMVRTALARGGPGLGYVTRLAPGYKVDRSASIRVSGRMAVKSGKDGQLVVTADYVWVYPLVGGKAKGTGTPGSTLVVLRSVESYEWYRPEAIAQSDRGLRPGGGDLGTSNMDCVLLEKGLLALGPPGQKGRPMSQDSAYSVKTKPDAFRNTC
jgi:hypothetical protein